MRSDRTIKSFTICYSDENGSNYIPQSMLFTGNGELGSWEIHTFKNIIDVFYNIQLQFIRRPNNHSQLCFCS